MVCRIVPLPGGGAAIVCGPRGRQRRCACGQPATLLCDWKIKGKKSGRCDRPVCQQHATKVGPDKDLCPEHEREYEKWKSTRKGKSDGG
jgi:hypothetical protein